MKSPWRILLRLTLAAGIFAAGMALGWLVATKSDRLSRFYFLLAFIFPLAFVPRPVAFAAITISMLILAKSSPVHQVAQLFSIAPLRLAGDLSYSVYFVHLLPTYFLLAFANRHGVFNGLSSGSRFWLAAAAVTPVIYAVAYLLHRSIEKPGIALGKSLSRRLILFKSIPLSDKPIPIDVS